MNFLELHKRKPLTTKERVENFKAHNGTCCICGGKIHVTEAWIDEHMLALAMGGTNEMSNRGIAHVKCAKVKTKDDMGQIAKAKRREAKFIGAKRPKQKIQSRGFKQQPSNTKYVNEGY